MAEEIEAKVKLRDPEALRRRMARYDPPAAGPVLEVNRLFDFADGALGRAGSALRVREEFRLDTGAAVRTLLTYKGPRRESRMKRREEFQTAVDSAAALVSVLGALGLGEVFRFEKHRTTWRVGECEAVLDEVPHLGWFAEVEGPTEAAVLAGLADLGLADEPIITKTYIRLLRDYLASVGRDPSRAVFGEAV